jgi:arginase family enzyme
VSAPCVGGLSTDLWLHAAWAGGRNPQVASFDIVECNPSFDIDGRTARLAALTVWQIVKGIGERLDGARRPRLGF